MSSSSLMRRLAATLAVSATTLGMITLTSAPAQAAAICGGNVSVYGILPDGRLTYTVWGNALAFALAG
ncbi:hypothetical protein GTW69_24435, partial [Streptomyces sp. SID7760]|nr:hypothetical protein [Streptomyces sp. SID7760]